MFLQLKRAHAVFYSRHQTRHNDRVSVSLNERNFMRRIYIFIIPFLFLAGVVRAQEAPATLAVFIKDALDHNPSLQAATARIRGAQAAVRQAGAWEPPQLGFEFYSTPVPYLNPFTKGQENDYSIQQMIMFPGKISAMEKMAGFNVSMKEQSALAVKRDLIAEVKKTYAMLLSAQKRTALNVDNCALMDQLIQSIRIRYETGQGIQADLLRAQVEREKLRNEESNLTQELRSAEAMMNMLRGGTISVTIGIVEDIEPAHFTWSLDSLLVLAASHRAELAAMHSDVAMNGAEKEYWKKQRLPDFMVRFMYKRMISEMPDDWALMFGMSLPIAPWSSAKYSGKIEEADANILATEAATRDMQNMIALQVREAWYRAAALWEQIERNRVTIIPQSEQTLRSLIAAYSTGKADLTSLIDAFRMYNMLKMDNEMLRSDYAATLAKLERAIGTDL